MKKVAIVGASGYSGEELVRLLLSHPHAELAAVTSRQYAGQTLAQVFPKFAHHPRARTLRFSEPKAELLAKQAQIVFLALPHGVAAEFAVPLLQLGCQVIDLSADFRVRSAGRLQGLLRARPSRAGAAGPGGLRPAGGLSRADQESLADRLPGLLPDQHPAADLAAAESGPGSAHRHHRRLAQRRQRRGAQGRARLPLRRVQRKRAALRHPQAPAPVGNRAGALPRRRARR